MSNKIKVNKVLAEKKDSEFEGLPTIDDFGRCQKEYFPNMNKDKYYRLLADICLTVLKKMKSPGCKYLYLLNK